jgi:hypothetical protein
MNVVPNTHTQDILQSLKKKKKKNTLKVVFLLTFLSLSLSLVCCVVVDTLKKRQEKPGRKQETATISYRPRGETERETEREVK